MGADCGRNPVVLYRYETQMPIFGLRFEPHWVLFCAASKVSPQHETLSIITTWRLGGVLGSIYSYCSNICPGLKPNQNATFGAHRLVRKNFPHRESNRGHKNYPSTV